MDVVMYSTGCPSCRVLKQKLDDKGIKYTVHDSVDEMLALGITKVPVLQVNGKIYEYNDALIVVQNM